MIKRAEIKADMPGLISFFVWLGLLIIMLSSMVVGIIVVAVVGFALGLYKIMSLVVKWIENAVWVISYYVVMLLSSLTAPVRR